MNGPLGRIRRDRLAIDGLAGDIEEPSQGVDPYGDRDGAAGIVCVHPTCQPVGGTHGDAPDNIIPRMLGNLHHKSLAILSWNFNGVI